jgi:adenine-specific DNA glycosylase
VRDDEGWRQQVRQRLLAWFEKHRRNLPWRQTRDPYAILVSEILLQQTTVEAARPYFERFLQRPKFARGGKAHRGKIRRSNPQRL